MSRSIWQISGGPPNRAYHDVFLKYGVALIGPGDSGIWLPERAGWIDETVRRFAVEVQPGDVFLLRSGLSTIRAVGLVASEYQYLSQFDDVNGWDLQHARRVRWFKLLAEHDFGTAVFSNAVRSSQVSQPEVLDYADRFVNSPPDYWKTAPLPALPIEDPLLDEPPAFLKDLLAQVNDLATLYENPQTFGERPAEDELIAHNIVPFLRALGWQVERIAIKWRYVDVSLFLALPRSPQNLAFIIEAKRLGAGVEGALEQARGYLQNLGVSRDVVVTDGLRYRMYTAEKDFAPLAYANLARLKRPAMQLFERMKRWN